MRIAFFGQSGPYAPVALRHLASQRQGAFSIALVVEGRKTPVGRRLHRWREPRPGLLPVTESLGDVAVAAGIRTLQTCDVNAPEAVEHVRAAQPDMLVCVGFDRLFGRALLATAPAGGINAHPSPLPELRGPSPIFWLLRSGARATALTLHALDEHEDHGVIYAQEPFVLPPRSTGDALYGLAGQLAGELLVHTLGQAAAGRLHGQPQDHSRATRAPRPGPEDALIDPAQWDCAHVVNFACGAPYFRTPWLRLGDDVFFLRRGVRAEPGRRLPADYVLHDDTLVVQCRDGAAILEVQV